MTATRGILNPATGLKNFSLSRIPPEGELTEFLETYWIVQWDLPDGQHYLSETIPFPVVHMVFETRCPEIYGVTTKRFSRKLLGKGRAFGVKFRPSMFYPFFGKPLCELTDRVVSVRSIFGDAGTVLRKSIMQESAENECVKLAQMFLTERLPGKNSLAHELRDIVELIATDRNITRVEQIALLAGCGIRQLQLNFRKYVGVSPKWVIMRYRLQEAADSISRGEVKNITELALQLGYFDQAHFTKEFSAVIGKPPQTYLMDQIAASEIRS